MESIPKIILIYMDVNVVLTLLLDGPTDPSILDSMTFLLHVMLQFRELIFTYHVDGWTTKLCIITTRQRSCGKVTFSLMCVCP